MPNNDVEKAKNHLLELAKTGIITKNNAKYAIDLIDKLTAKGFSKNRLKKYAYSISTLSQLYGKDFDKATQKDLNRLATIIRDKFNGETPRDYLVILRIFMKYIRESQGKKYKKNEFPEELVDIEPGNRKFKKILPTELLTIEDIKKLANCANNLRDRCFVIMLYESGCRIGELIGDDNYPGVLLKHIESTKYGVKVTVIGKTGSRVLYLLSSAPAISSWLQEHPDRSNKNAPLFCGIWTNRGKKVKYRYWNDLLTGNESKRKSSKGNRGKGLGEKAGINKPLNPHHFRHSRLTELAKQMTESQLCCWAGWEQGSKQARNYIHMSGRDIENTILAMHGIRDEKNLESEFKPIICPRCGIKNDPASKFCKGCNLGLDIKTVIDFEKTKNDINSNIISLIKDKEQALKMLESLAQLLKNSDNIDNIASKKYV